MAYSVVLIITIIAAVVMGGLTGFLFAIAGWPGAGVAAPILALITAVFINDRLTMSNNMNSKKNNSANRGTKKDWSYYLKQSSADQNDRKKNE